MLQQRLQAQSDGSLKVSEAPHPFCSSDTRGSKVMNGYLAAEHQESFGDVSYLAGASLTAQNVPGPRHSGFPVRASVLCHKGGKSSSHTHSIVHLFTPGPEHRY